MKNAAFKPRFFMSEPGAELVICLSNCHTVQPGNVAR